VAAPTHYLKKRDLLYGPRTSPATLSAAAREYMSRDAYSDATDFFERAEDEDGLKEIKQHALKTGDTFLLTRLERIDPKWVNESDWEQVKEIAEKRKIFSMAAFAERKLRPPEEASSETETVNEEKAEEDTEE